MLPGVSDNQRVSSADTGVDSDDDRGRRNGSALWLDPSPPVLAFGSQNVTALLVELRRRERLTVRRCSARLVPAPWPSTDEEHDLSSDPTPGLRFATHRKEQP